MEDVSHRGDSRPWSIFYGAVLMTGLWFGCDLERHTEVLSVPMMLVVMALGNDVMLNRRRYIPRSMRRLVKMTLRWGARAQVGACMLMVGLGCGLAAHVAGLDPYVHSPLNILDDSAVVRGRAAADAFAENKAETEKTLLIIEGLIDKGNLAMAETRLRPIDDDMAALHRSYAKDFVDVVELQKHVDAVHVAMAAHRQSLIINQALNNLASAGSHLDQVDAAIARHRFDLASHLWVKAQQEVDDIKVHASVGKQLTLLADRLETQRERIRKGFQNGKKPVANQSSVADSSPDN